MVGPHVGAGLGLGLGRGEQQYREPEAGRASQRSRPGQEEPAPGGWGHVTHRCSLETEVPQSVSPRVKFVLILCCVSRSLKAA